MKKGFTLIELLVVITILAILAGAALPFVQNYVDESRQAKAKSDLDEIARALVVYESREGEYNKSTVEDLTGRYLDRSPIDPWGVPYIVATESGIVYSLGPDRKDYDGTPATEEYGYDNIEVAYVPPLALVSVKWIDKNKSGAVDTQNVQDELHLSFSRKLGTDTVNANITDISSKIALSSDTAGILLSDITNSASAPRVVGNGKILVYAITKNGCFVAGHDTLTVVDGHGIIQDCATPTPNLCIASQAVKILPQ